MTKKRLMILSLIILLLVPVVSLASVDWSSIIDRIKNGETQFSIDNTNLSVNNDIVSINGGQITNITLSEIVSGSKVISTFIFDNVNITGNLYIARSSTSQVYSSPLNITFQKNCNIEVDNFGMGTPSPYYYMECRITNYGKINTYWLHIDPNYAKVHLINNGSIEASYFHLQSNECPEIIIENNGHIKIAPNGYDFSMLITQLSQQIIKLQSLVNKGPFGIKWGYKI